MNKLLEGKSDPALIISEECKTLQEKLVASEEQAGQVVSLKAKITDVRPLGEIDFNSL
jgi:hypothetical protein